MKLLVTTLRCGGKMGCGMLFEFREGATVEEAREAFRAHRDAPEHERDAFEWQNRNRLAEGLAPMTLEEFRK